MSDKEMIKICLEEISNRLGYTDAGALRQRHLEHLSAEIENSTGTLISVSTLKRLLNGAFNRLPQVATLNAITSYLGYDGWQDFRMKKQDAPKLPEVILPPAPVVPAGPTATSAHNTNKRWTSYKVLAPAIAVTLFLVLVSLNYFSKPGGINEKNISFSVKKVTSNDIPNTVVFSYDLEKINGDSFFIQQSWDSDRRVRIEKDKHTLTDIYYEPGYHVARLIVNDQVVKTIDVSIPTNGWFFMSKPEIFRGLPAYIRPAAPVQNGSLSLTREDIINSKIDPQLENYYMYTFFPATFNTESDNFHLKTRIRWKELKNVVCPRIMFEVCGQSNSLFFFTSLPGCTGSIDANIGEHFMSGKTTDLSGFGGDIHEWQDVEVTVKNKEAVFSINKKEVFRKNYTKSPGLITGLVFSSNGLCEIDHVALRGLDGKIVYENSFDQ